VVSSAPAEDWTQFRGPHGDSIVRDSNCPQEWGEQSHVTWKVPLSGRGWSQPVVAHGRVFVAMAECAEEETPRRFERGIVPDAADARKFEYRWKLLCLSADSGTLLWEQTAFEGKPKFRKHRSNTFASETPATDGERVVAYFGMTGIACYDFEGTRLWSTDLGAFPMQAGWGTGSSPIIHGDAVIVQCDNEQQSFLVALDKRTGAESWRILRDEPSNWSTPYVWKNKVRTELVVAGGKKMRSYDPVTHEVLWEMAGSGRTSLSPVGNDELLFVDSVERIMGSPGRLAAIRAGASGDLSLKPDQLDGPSIAWSVMLSTYRNASPLLYADCLYLLEQHGNVVRCYDARTGELNYQQRLPGAAGSTASPWAAEGRIYCLDEVGRTTVLASGPQYKVPGANLLAEDLFWASPAFAGDHMFVRSLQHLYCIREQ
jgi:outer membrane protein assembly factor BamB